jgi:predicted membrane channel-forming protein YqfA (hemolysin III family)
MDSFLTLLILCGGALLSLALGPVYFVKAAGAGSVARRLATSAFGPTVALLFVASLLWPDSHRFNPRGTQLFLAMHLLPLALLFIAIVGYPGPKRLHWFLLPIGLLAWLWTLALGWIFVHGK